LAVFPVYDDLSLPHHMGVRFLGKVTGLQKPITIVCCRVITSFCCSEDGIRKI